MESLRKPAETHFPSPPNTRKLKTLFKRRRQAYLPAAKPFRSFLSNLILPDARFWLWFIYSARTSVRAECNFHPVYIYACECILRCSAQRFLHGWQGTDKYPQLPLPQSMCAFVCVSELFNVFQRCCIHTHTHSLIWAPVIKSLIFRLNLLKPQKIKKGIPLGDPTIHKHTVTVDRVKWDYRSVWCGPL